VLIEEKDMIFESTHKPVKLV